MRRRRREGQALGILGTPVASPLNDQLPAQRAPSGMQPADASRSASSSGLSASAAPGHHDPGSRGVHERRQRVLRSLQQDLRLYSSTDTDLSEDEQEQQRLPSLRLTTEDEQSAKVEGHFVRRLEALGMLDGGGQATEYGAFRPPGSAGSPLAVSINKLLTPCRRWQTVLGIVRDLAHVMDSVNASTVGVCGRA